MSNYYNELDPWAAQTLRNLIAAGHISPGVVDERSIEDVKPSDLAGYTQCHFFAGVGAWSLALRRAGWPDSRQVWTGSCPCQPFSTAGKGVGFADERHLWPAFHWLISQREPAAVIGEQVASRDADPWIDLVQTDMEALGYAFGAVPFPSAGVGAPHIRDRLYWVGHTHDARLEGLAGNGGAAGWCGASGSVAEAGVSGGVGHAHSVGARRNGRSIPGAQSGGDGQHLPVNADASGGAGGMADALPAGRTEGRPGAGFRSIARGGEPEQRPSPTNGLWRAADWLLCRDGKWRPVEPDTFPLAHGAPARVGRLRAYGNAINVEAARVFIESLMT